MTDTETFVSNPDKPRMPRAPKANPLPRGRKPIYPWKTIGIGECFITDAKITKVGAAASQFASRNPGYKFTCETQPDLRVKVKRIATEVSSS